MLSGAWAQLLKPVTDAEATGGKKRSQAVAPGQAMSLCQKLALCALAARDQRDPRDPRTPCGAARARPAR
jgi:hypothetical protein